MDTRRDSQHKVHTHSAVRWNVRSLHSQCDAIESNEEQHTVVKPAPRDQVLTEHTQSETKKQ